MNTKEIEKDFVSVCVITYNSGGTIIETLNSILNQTYDLKKVELIISDDCSMDNTVETIMNWIAQNKNSFFNIKFVTNNKNLGISQNFERVIRLSNLEWIKTIAGDDILRKDAVERLLETSRKNSNKIFFGQVSKFYMGDNEEKVRVGIAPSLQEISKFNVMYAQQQFEYLLRNNIIMAPTLFLNRMLINVVLEAPKFGCIEDYSTWLFLTAIKNVKLHICNYILVDYRVGGVSNSLRNSKMDLVFRRSQIQTLYYYSQFIKSYRLRHIVKLYVAEQYSSLLRDKGIIDREAFFSSLKYSIGEQEKIIEKAYIGRGILKYNLSEKVQNIIFRPLNNYCVVNIKSILVNGAEVNSYSTNAIYIVGNTFYFNTLEPEIYVMKETILQSCEIVVDIEFLFIGVSAKEALFDVWNEILISKDKDINLMENTVKLMRNSFSWKITRPLRFFSRFLSYLNK